MFVNPASLTDTVEALRTGRVDLSDYVDRVCDRVEELNSHIEALLPEEDRRRRLHTQAIELQERFKNSDGRPPLYGALVAVKDIFHVDGFIARAGSVLPPHLFAGPEALAVRMLRDAGALVLGKSVTTEFAYSEPGPTRNPHNLAHTPGGSSSGSAAAVAAGLCPLALGTQTIGSVIRPAAFCGIVGFKPTLNRTPTAGLVYFSRSLDQAGYFTQDMPGMALAAAVLCQAWKRIPAPRTPLVLGVPDGPYLEQVEPEGLKAFGRHLSLLEEIGCRIKRLPTLLNIDQLNQLHRRLIFAEFAQEHAVIYSEHAALYRPRTAEVIEIGQRVGYHEVSDGRANCGKLRAGLEAQMTEANIDLCVCPSTLGPAPEGLGSTGDPSMSLPWTHAGMPSITLPAGKAENGLPLGLQFVAPVGADEYLIACCRILADRMR
jgi:Asp-tRNA(Asn)/Glu-tRNA(Gln) amidotransferase A subunit family amidase